MEFNYKLNWSSAYDDKGTLAASSSADQARRTIEQSLDSIKNATDRAAQSNRDLGEARVNASQSDEIVRNEVRIIDYARRSREEIEKQVEAFTAQQREWERAAQARGDSRLAVDPASVFEETKAIEEVTVATGNFSDMLSNPKLTRGMLTMSNNLARMTVGYNSVAGALPTLIGRIAGPGGLAVGVGLAVTGLGMLIKRMREGKDAAENMATPLEEINKSIEGMESGRLEEAWSAIEKTYEALKDAHQSFEEIHRAEGRYATSALSNSEKIAEANRLIATLLGEQVDAYAELDAREARLRETRQLAARQQAEALARGLDEQRTQITLIDDQQEATKSLLETERERLQALKGEFLAFHREREALESIPRFDAQEAAAASERGQAPSASQEFLKAQERLGSSTFVDSGRRIQARMGELNDEIEKLEETFEDRERRLQNTIAALNTREKAVAVELQQIAEELAADEFLAAANMLTERSNTLAEGTKKIAESVEATTPRQQAAIDAILKAAEDGKIAADETETVARSLTTLIGALQTNTIIANENVHRLIEEGTQQQERLRAQENRIRLLEQKSRRQ